MDAKATRNAADLPLDTLDNNALIALRNNEPNAPAVHELLELNRAGLISLTVIVSTSMEAQRATAGSSSPLPATPSSLRSSLHAGEGVWNYLKCVGLGNLCCQDLVNLADALRRANERMRHKRTIIQACSRQAGYCVAPGHKRE